MKGGRRGVAARGRAPPGPSLLLGRAVSGVIVRAALAH